MLLCECFFFAEMCMMKKTRVRENREYGKTASTGKSRVREKREYEKNVSMRKT